MLRLIAGCAALAMLASLFVPWIQIQFAGSFVPWDAVTAFFDMDGNTRARLMDRAPPAELVTFGLSFVASALFLLTGAASRLLALAAGVLPFATVAIPFSRVGQPGQGFGSDLPSLNSDAFSRQMSELLDIAGPGLGLWFGGAVVLLLLGAFVGRRRSR